MTGCFVTESLIKRHPHVIMCYRKWYQYWGHCGVTNDLGSSPQPVHKYPLCYSCIWVGLTSGTIQIKFKFHTLINSSVSDKKQALSKMSLYQQSNISLYSWFLSVLSCTIFLITFHGSIFLNIKLGPTTTSSPRRRGRGCITMTHHMTKFGASDWLRSEISPTSW